MGEWGELGGLILTNWSSHEFDTNPECFDSMYNGMDFGFNHANALLELGLKDGELYICQEQYLYEKDTVEHIELAEGKFQKNILTWCDSAEPDRIQMWQKAGYNAKGVKKSQLQEKNKMTGSASVKGSVHAQIDWLKSVKIHIHPSCINTLKEIQQWKWQKDQKTNQYTDDPVDIFDDAMAALRYGIESIRKSENALSNFLQFMQESAE